MEKEVNSMQIKFRIKNRTVSNIRAKLFMHSENWNTRDFFFTWLKFRLVQNEFYCSVTLENYVYSVCNYKTTLLDTVHFYEMKTIYLASYDRSAECAKIFQMIPRISFGLVLVSVLYSDTENRCYNEYSSVVLCVVVRCVVQTSLSYKVYIAVG